MAWTTYKALDVPDTFDPAGNAGEKLTDDLKELADRAPYKTNTAPGAGDDVNDGFEPGSTWLDTSTGFMWICIDNTSTVAVWRTLYLRTSSAIVLSPGDGSSVSGQRGLQLDSGGDARGTNGVDLQTSRSESYQVASGNYSVIGGGSNNWISTDHHSTICGGYGNITSGALSSVGGGSGNIAGDDYATVGGGQNNAADAYHSTVGGGYDNTANGEYCCVNGGGSNDASSDFASVVSGGFLNVASEIYSSVGGGYGNTAEAYSTTISGGYDNRASEDYSTVSGGREGKSRLWGQLCHSSGMFQNIGDAQHSVYNMRQQTTDATPTNLFLDGSESRLTLPAESTWCFSVKVSAYSVTDNLGAAYYVTGAIRRNNANATALLGAVSKESFEDAGMGSCDVSVTADDSNEALDIQVTGLADKTIKWHAVIEVSEVCDTAP